MQWVTLQYCLDQLSNSLSCFNGNFNLITDIVMQGDMGVYPRCAECKKARKSYAYCGTHTSVFTCLNRKPLGMEYKDRESGIKSGIIHPG